jgi:hypothetical protein
MLGASATRRMPREPPTRPISIQGRRIPSGEAVRSLSLPKNGFPTIANRPPIPVTNARLLGACSIPTSELTFNARVTSRGARNSRLVLMYANVYSVQRDESPSDPVCHGRLTLEPSLRCGPVVQPVLAGGGRQMRAGAWGVTPEPGT